MNDLTTLSTAKSWLSITSDTDDVQLQRLIRAVSAFVLSYIGRKTVVKTQFVDQFTGNGGGMKALRNYPVIAVGGVVGDGQSVPTAAFSFDPDGGTPYGNPQFLNLDGYAFPARAPCSVTYTAGYFVTNEPQTAAASVSVDGFDGSWIDDGGVTYVGGAALVAVALAPSQGQYALGDRGEYLFAPADFGAAVLISYSFVPAQLEQACLELVAERYAYKDRVGQSSVNVSGSIVSYKLSDMPEYVRVSLAPFRRVVPI